VGTGDSEHFAQRVAELTLPGRLQGQVAPLLAVLKQVNEQVAKLDAELDQLCRQDEQLRRLCTLPYVGPVTACAFASTPARVYLHGRVALEPPGAGTAVPG
jgi:transposase